MTPGELQRLSALTLEAFFNTLTGAHGLPVGHYNGQAWLASHPRLTRWLFGLVWAGKVFTGETVVNRILGMRLIEGLVHLEPEDIVIDYPQWQLQDRIRPITPWIYLGRMVLGSRLVYFTLEPA